MIVFAYVHLAKREESVLTARFGEAYQAYRRHLPMFFPRWEKWGRFLHALFFPHPE